MLAKIIKKVKEADGDITIPSKDYDALLLEIGKDHPSLMLMRPDEERDHLIVKMQAVYRGQEF